jgi:MFS family permease
MDSRCLSVSLPPVSCLFPNIDEILENSLTHGAFVLVSGRIGAVYGHQNTVLLGGAWWILWSVINGFCNQSLISFAIARAFAGVGAAFVMPNIVAIIGTTFPPGRMRNFTLGLFGFGCSVGGSLGAFFMGVFIEFVEWRWFFFAMFVLGCH